MGKCRWTYKVEAYFDQEAPETAGVEAHLESCADCAGYLTRLQAMRQGVVQVRRNETIADAQVHAFMDGIRDRMEAPARGLRGLWAGLSLVTAAVLAAFALLTIFSGPDPIRATEVESVTTELEGYTLDYSSKDNVTTIYLRPPRGYEEDIQ
jgi:anti-sigma factor RsiW